MKKINIGMIGLGTVGTGVYKILTEQRQLLEARLGLSLHLKKIVVRDPKKKREVNPPKELLSSNIKDILDDPEISLVIEVMGGADNDYPRQALEKGKHVVTANKALLAERGKVLFKLAEERGLFLGYEAAVAGGIPVIRAMEESFVGNNLQQIHGIINGTANYILSQMTEQGSSFDVALKEAQRQGFAEQDPKMDIEGIDAAQKLALLISLGFGVTPQVGGILVEGIRNLTHLDIAFATKLGYVVKLLAIAKSHGNKIEARVHPTMIPQNHPLGKIHGVFNAILLNGDAVGEVLFWGRGAGMMPTASAVVSDVGLVARFLSQGVKAPLIQHPWKELSYLPADELQSEFYLRFSVVDQAGVMAQIAGILGQKGISISSIYQQERDEGNKVPVVVMTHEAAEQQIRQALQEIDKLKTVLDKTVVIRVER